MRNMWDEIFACGGTKDNVVNIGWTSDRKCVMTFVLALGVTKNLATS